MEAFFNKGTLASNYQGPSQFIRWQQEFLPSAEGLDKRAFWAHILKPVETIKENIESGGKLYGAVHQEMMIQGKELQQLKELVSQLNLPVNAVFMAAHQQWLQEIKKMNGYLQGITVNGREQMQSGVALDKILGVIDNLLPIPFTEHLKDLDAQMVREIYMNYLEIREHQEIPYETLREDFNRDHQSDLEQFMVGAFNFREFANVNSGELSEDTEVKISQDNRVYDYPSIDLICLAYEDILKIRISMPQELYDTNEAPLSLNYFLSKISMLTN
jgi:hypothetical protein